MNTFDDYYYGESRQINNPAYDWEHFILTAGMESNELDLTKDDLIDDEVIKYRRFIHEYIHYLQNFTTTWGCFSASNFFLSYLRIGVSSIEKPVEKVRLPLVYGSYDFKSEYLKSGLEKRFKQIQHLELSDHVVVDTKRNIKPIEFRFENRRVVIDNGVVQRTIGLKCIREQMAFLGEMLFMGFSDLQISEFINSNNGFLFEGQKPGQQSEYWILFEYFYHNYKNVVGIGLGLFCLLNECLTRLNPDITLYKFCFFIRSGALKISPNTNFIAILDEWIGTREEVLNYNKSRQYSYNAVNELFNTTQKYSNNDLVVSIREISKKMLINLKSSEGGRKTFFEGFSDLKAPMYWHDLIIKYGSPIIVFNDEVRIIGSPDYTANSSNNFLFINAVSMVLKKLHDKELEFMCPYFLDVNICTHPMKSQNVCGRNALEILNKVDNTNHCQLSSGIALLGFKERLF